MISFDEAIARAFPWMAREGRGELQEALESQESYYLMLGRRCAIKDAAGNYVVVPEGVFIAVSKETGEVRMADMGAVPFYVSGLDQTDDELDIEGATPIFFDGEHI